MSTFLGGEEYLEVPRDYSWPGTQELHLVIVQGIIGDRDLNPGLLHATPTPYQLSSPDVYFSNAILYCFCVLLHKQVIGNVLYTQRKGESLGWGPVVLLESRVEVQDHTTGIKLNALICFPKHLHTGPTRTISRGDEPCPRL